MRIYPEGQRKRINVNPTLLRKGVARCQIVKIDGEPEALFENVEIRGPSRMVVCAQTAFISTDAEVFAS